MNDLYNFNQHTHYVCILLEKSEVTCKLNKSLYYESDNINNLLLIREKTIIIYNNQKTDVLAWGNIEFEQDNNWAVYDDFLNGLYHIFKKGKNNWDADDIFYTEAVSQFLELMVEYLMSEGEIENLDALHYAFIVPSEWEIEIQEDLIRPIFTKTNLISKNDHKDRLLFLSDSESTSYFVQKDSFDLLAWDNAGVFDKKHYTVMCGCSFTDKDTVVIKIDLIKTANTLFDIPDSVLIPKIMFSDSFFINSTSIKHSIKVYLKNNLFPNKKDPGHTKNIDTIVDYIYNKRIYKNFNIALTVKEWEEKEDYQLNNSQKMFLNFIHPIDMLPFIDKNLYNKIKFIVSENSMKKYCLLLLEHLLSFPAKQISIPLLTWINYILQYNISFLNDISQLDIKKMARKSRKEFCDLEFTDDMIQLDLDKVIFGILDGYRILKGIATFTLENIRNSNMYCTPSIMPNENQISSSSIFKNSKPDAIINIDISFKSTLLSYSILNEEGLIVKMFDHNYFTDNKCLPSLETFYNVTASEKILKTKKQFISFFAENYLWSDIKLFCADKNFLFQIEAILNGDQFSKEERTSTHQPKYIKAFLLMYFIYIKNIILSKLTTHEISEKSTVLKTCYAITVEKVLLDNIIGNKEDFKELLYTSGLLSKNDDSKKLRVVIKGEEVLSLIQPYLKLEFPVRSHFILAQLHENYVQLTLNQVVTASNLEGKQQEAIIMEDRVIAIQNIYDSLSLYMWNNLIQNNNLLQLCAIHSEDRILELFSLTTKIQFRENYQRHIKANILASNTDLLKFDKICVDMNHSCNCKINLTISDVIEISFKPLLKKITSVCMGSMINKNIFGEYKNIDYHFSLIYFNQNMQLLDIIINIFNEECKNFNPEQGIDTECIEIPELPAHFFQTNLNHQPYLYKGFTIGTLHQIYTESYALRFDIKDQYEVKIDKDTVGVENNGFLPLFRKGDIISNTSVVKLFYLVFPYIEESKIYFDFHYKINSDLEWNETIAATNKTWRRISYSSLDFEKFDRRKPLITLPVMVTFKPPGHFSNPQILIKEIGEDTTCEKNIIERAYTMTLSRF